jgi:uncharacterized membrane protein (UPF0127 family)
VDGVQLLAVAPAAVAGSGHGAGRYRSGALLLLVLGLVVVMVATACSSGARSVAPSGPTSTPVPGATTVPASSAPAAPLVPTGFSAITLRVTDAAGVVHESCVLVADTDAKRQRGLMDVDSLGGYDGMIFRFPSPSTDAFYMYRTRLPLTVAFFGSDGAFISARDMAPCTATNGDDCPLYRSAAAYTNALEVAQGGLAAVGAGPGSRIELGGPCQRSASS